MPEIGNLEHQLLNEIHGMREDFRRVSQEVAALAVEVRHLVEDGKETKGHGERIRALEQDVSNLNAANRSLATERRWVVGLLVTSGIAIGAIVLAIITLFVRHT